MLVRDWRSGVRWAEDAERQTGLVWASGCDPSTHDRWWECAKRHGDMEKKGLVGDNRRARNNKKTYESTSTKQSQKQNRLRRWISNCARYPSIDTLPRSTNDHLYISLTVDIGMLFVKGAKRAVCGPWSPCTFPEALLTRRGQGEHHIEPHRW